MSVAALSHCVAPSFSKWSVRREKACARRFFLTRLSTTCVHHACHTFLHSPVLQCCSAVKFLCISCLLVPNTHLQLKKLSLNTHSARKASALARSVLRCLLLETNTRHARNARRCCWRASSAPAFACCVLLREVTRKSCRHAANSRVLFLTPKT